MRPALARRSNPRIETMNANDRRLQRLRGDLSGGMGDGSFAGENERLRRAGYGWLEWVSRSAQLAEAMGIDFDTNAAEFSGAFNAGMSPTDACEIVTDMHKDD